MKQVFSDKRVVSAFILNFLEMGAYVSTVGYVNLGLMSQYDATILPYFYFSQAIVAVIIMAASYRLIHRKPVLYSNVYYLTTGIIFIISYMLLINGFSEAVFPTSVLLSVLTFQNAAVIGNTVALAFDIREFVHYSNWLLAADAFGGVFFGITLPIFIIYLGGESLLIINSLILFGCLFMSLKLKPLFPPVERKMHTINPMKNSFFRLVLSQRVILLVIFVLMDSAFKIALQQYFDKDMIGNVSTLFTGLTSSVLIAYAFYCQKHFIPRYGIVNTITLYPLFMILASPFLILFPVWFGVLFTYGVIHVLYDGTYTAFQTFLNTIPRKMQMLGKTQLSLLTLIIGEAGIAVTILYLLGENATVPVIVLICMLFSFLSLIFMRHIRQEYSEALGKQIEYQRVLPFEDFYATKKDIKEMDISKLIPLIGHDYSVHDVSNHFKNVALDPVPYLIKDLETIKDISNFEARVSLLGKICSNKADEAYIELLKSSSLLIPNSVAQSLATHAIGYELSKDLKNAVMTKLQHESNYIRNMKALLQNGYSEFLHLEIKSRLQLAVERFFYYYASVSKTRKVLNSLPNLFDQIFLKTDKIKRGDSIEFIESLTTNHHLKRLLRDTLEHHPEQISHAQSLEILNQDEWFQYLLTVAQFVPGEKMDINERILFLRKVKLFESLSPEVLRIISELMSEISFKEKDIIFKQGDIADYVYFIVSGEVTFIKNGAFLKEEKAYGMFGEVSSIDNSPRRATVCAKTDVVLLSMRKEDFDQLLEDIPLLNKIIILQLISYLK